MKRKILAVAGIAIAMFASAVVAATPAQANSTTIVAQSTKSVNYSKTKNIYSPAIKRCIRVTATGKMSVSYLRTTDYLGGDYQSLTNPKLTSMKLSVVTTKTCSSSTRAAVSKLQMTQAYSYYKCDGDVSYSVGYPWSAGISWTYTCGNVKAMKRTTSYSSGSSFSQSNSNIVGTVHKVSYGVTSSTVTSCVAASALVTAWYPSTNSDTMKFGLGSICISV